MGAQREYLLLHRRPEHFAIWQGVTGGVEDGESVPEAAGREVEEEVGIPMSPEGLRPFGEPHTFEPGEFFESRFPDHSRITEHWFHAEIPRQPPVLSPEEHDAYRWCSLVECLELLHWDANRRALLQLEGILSSEEDRVTE